MLRFNLIVLYGLYNASNTSVRYLAQVDKISSYYRPMGYPWVSQTPHNPTEALSQTAFVKSRIRGHQGSSPTPIFQAVKHMAKGIEAMAHEMTLIKEENHNLRNANEALSKRRRAKKTRVR